MEYGRDHIRDVQTKTSDVHEDFRSLNPSFTKPGSLNCHSGRRSGIQWIPACAGMTSVVLEGLG